MQTIGSLLAKLYAQLGPLPWRYFIAAVLATAEAVFFTRSVVTGAIKFRGGSYIARDREPVLFWFAVLLFTGIGAVVAVRICGVTPDTLRRFIAL
jgi:hypothetical protein